MAAGLGAGHPYIELVRTSFEERGDVEVLDLSASAMMITESMAKLEAIIAFNPDLIIVAHGITEAIIRPSSCALAWMPSRWRRPGWMDPRPYFSHRLARRLFQRLESAFRWRVKVILVRYFSKTRWMSPAQYADVLQRLVGALHRRSSALVVLVSHPGIDDRYFPGSGASLDRFWGMTLKVAMAAEEPARLESVDVRRSCNRWQDFSDDHFHPDSRGHEKIAQSVLAHLSNSQHAKDLSMSSLLGGV